mmetsp:Transcript_76821/g.144763  ORF Transcript_76821/g.144763 Transcript_76821/m.144763 type:complete len:378 (-) Transcript_76821:107-1240(-)
MPFVLFLFSLCLAPIDVEGSWLVRKHPVRKHAVRKHPRPTSTHFGSVMDVAEVDAAAAATTRSIHMRDGADVDIEAAAIRINAKTNNFNVVKYGEHTVFYGRPAMFTKRRHVLHHDKQITLDSPAPVDVPYNLVNPRCNFFSQWLQDKYLWPKVLGPITEYYSNLSLKYGVQLRPFFVESGARDGEEHSNTLLLEREKGWNGVLVEPSNISYPLLLEKKRTCYAWHGCLSPTGKAEDVNFLEYDNGRSHIGGKARDKTVPAEPLHSLLKAIKKGPAPYTVDFWSLDIEGSEAPVLETTNFKAIEVGVLMIEMNKSPEKSARIRAVMKANSFVKVGKTQYDHGSLDGIFANEKYFHRRGISLPQNLTRLVHFAGDCNW